ncbi:unnamed protein product, partial [Rotaria magnacalcarata]
VSNRKWFSLICDESTLEQLCVGIRSNAEAIVEAIFDTLTRCGLNISACRGQSYDGASSMSGIYGDISALVLKQ